MENAIVGTHARVSRSPPWKQGACAGALSARQEGGAEVTRRVRVYDGADLRLFGKPLSTDTCLCSPTWEPYASRPSCLGRLS